MKTREELIAMFEKVGDRPISEYTAEEYAGFALACNVTRLTTVWHGKEPKPQNVIDAAAILDELSK